MEKTDKLQKTGKSKLSKLSKLKESIAEVMGKVSVKVVRGLFKKNCCPKLRQINKMLNVY